jgi:hypothetical protein
MEEKGVRRVKTAGVTKKNKTWSKRRCSWRNEQKKQQGRCILEKKLMMRIYKRAL